MSMDSMSLPPELQKLVDANPVELVWSGPERFGPLNPEALGAWRFVIESFVPVTLVWTDWREGFGSLTLVECPTNTAIDKYIVLAKGSGIGAGWGYKILEKRIKDFDGNVTLTENQTGKLAGAWTAAEGKPRTQEATNES